ncbi:MAG: NADH-quinone oxidoreductase subunit N, partial [Algisphaera sp.]
SLSARGEFYAFFLLSITGVMLTAGATDLVWLFLALELTSLPTYVMIATTRDRTVAHEAAVKYFFLGAMSAALFLYGFALIYGATGFTEFGAIAATITTSSETGLAHPSPLMLLGIVLAVLGLCFKVAAVPMHVYVADVYQGAATPVTAFLAVVPKVAGFAALILVLQLLGLDRLPMPIVYLLAAIGVLTMTLGNVLAIIQTNLKRVLAYSSVANSGYMMLGLMAGLGTPGQALGNGPAAVLFFLLVYGLGSIGAFAVISMLQAQRGAHHPIAAQDNGVADDLEYDDIAGLWWRSPVLGGVLLVSTLSLVGMPPLAGFLGKLYLIGGVFEAGFYGLVIVLVINSAVSAGYYLRIAMTTFFGTPNGPVAEVIPSGRRGPRVVGALLTVFAALIMGGWPANRMVRNTREAFKDAGNIASRLEQPRPTTVLDPVSVDLQPDHAAVHANEAAVTTTE